MRLLPEGHFVPVEFSTVFSTEYLYVQLKSKSCFLSFRILSEVNAEKTYQVDLIK